MTPAQKRLRELRDRQSRDRQKMAEFAQLDELDDESRSALDAIEKSTPDLERQLRAAMAALSEEERASIEKGAQKPPDAEQREKIELRNKALLGNFILAKIEGRAVTGVEAEYSASCGISGGNFPIAIFESGRPVEERVATNIPATGLGATLAPIQPFVFSESIAPRLGIAQPQVGSGAYSEATISTSLSANPQAKDGAQAATAAVITTTTAKPRRIAARLTIRMEDVLEIGVANFESALRMNATQKLADVYDFQCIAGNGTSPNVNGLINQLTDPADPTAIATFDAFVSAFVDQVDGLWAMTGKDVKVVTNPDAWKLSAKTFRDIAAADLGDTAFADYAMMKYGAWWCNSRMPATDATIARGIVYRMGRPGLRTASHAVWASSSITDIYSDSASGLTHFTLAVYVGDTVQIIQPDAYDLVEFKVA